MAVPIREIDQSAETTLGLVRRLMEDLTTLFRQEMALATAELSGTLTKVVAGVVSMAAGGAVLYAGFLALLAAAILGLANVVAPWLAALIVGGVVTLIGLVMLVAGRKALDPEGLKPQRSPESLRKDKEVLTGEAR